MGAERDKTVDELLQAREAYDRRDWALALDRLTRLATSVRGHDRARRRLPTSSGDARRGGTRACSPGTRT